MKLHTTLILSFGVSVALAISAQAGGHHGNGGSNGNSAPSSARSTAPASFRSGTNVHYSGGRTFTPSSRFSSIQRGTTFNQRRFNSATLHRPTAGGIATQINRNRAQNLGAIRNHGQFRSQKLANSNRAALANNRHVFARRSAANWHHDWDRRHDHWWNGHRCHFVNGSWIIFDIGFLPWYGYPYDYYAYDPYYYPNYPYPTGYGYGYGYGYGDNNDNGYDSDVDDGAQPQANYTDEDGNNYYDSSNRSTDSTISSVQEKLARKGYYRGEIDGLLGPATRRAIVRYQSNNGLHVTGSLTRETLQSLSLPRVARD